MALFVELLYVAIHFIVKLMSMRAEDEIAGLRQLWLFERRAALMNGVSGDHALSVQRKVQPMPSVGVGEVSLSIQSGNFPSLGMA
jgi:hypothetical protein